MKMQFEAYVASLPNCVNRELIDKVTTIVQDYCYKLAAILIDSLPLWQSN
jgi:hypothetical protein